MSVPSLFLVLDIAIVWISNKCIDKILELTFDAPTEAKVRYVKHYTCAKSAKCKIFSPLIGPNDVVCALWRYKNSRIVLNQSYFRWSDKWVVNTSIGVICVYMITFLLVSAMFNYTYPTFVLLIKQTVNSTRKTSASCYTLMFRSQTVKEIR